MAVSWSTPELAARFSRYVEELREFLATSSVHYGSADDLAAVAIRIDAVPSFRDDLSSLVRAIILREGGVVPRTNLLEILAIAIGGNDFDQAGREIQEPLGRILAFVNRVISKPWNEPPGETRLKPESSPTLREMPRPVAREALPAIPENLTPSSTASEGESSMEGYGAMLAARHKVVPISAHRPLESRRPVPPAAARGEWPIASGGTIPPPSSGEGMFSRLNHVERQADTRPGPNPAPVPGPIPDPIPPPPPPLVASAQLLPPAVDPILAPTALAETAAAVEVSHAAPPHRTVFLSSNGPETLAPPPLEAPAAREIRSAKLSFPKLSIPKLPKFSLPKFRPPSIPLSKFSAPRMSPVLVFGVALAGAGVAVFTAVRVLVSQPRPQSQSTARPPTLPPAVAASTTATPPTDTASVGPAPTPAPTASRPSKPSPYGSPRYDNYIAPPYSRPIPGQSAPAQPIAVAPAPEPPAPRSQPYASDLRPASFSGPAPIVRIARPVNPDATYVGAPAEERTADSNETNLPPPPRRRHTVVAASVMRSNLLSAPAPGYPLLAKIAHLQGQVVLEAVVAPNGTVSDAHVVRGHHLLRGAAVDAVRRWRYRPYLVNGQPAEVTTTITLDFPTPESPRTGKSASRPLASQQKAALTP